jgi:6-methylpretetramide 4-monooxygenase / 4-hydroxy-6-methylpretetramide 12a-monooxygenase
VTCDNVLIIGAGPSGLFAAAELARHGVRARLIEKDVRLHREARATAIQPGTLEILNSVGLLPQFLAASERIHCARLYGPGMSELAAMSHDGIGCKCEFQCSLPQYETQRILEEHLVSLGGAVERGVTATKVEADGDEVVVELEHLDGQVETVRPEALIGAGGSHSVTRHSVNEPLEGTTYRGQFLVADIAMPSPLPRNEAGVVCTSEGLLLLAPLPGGRWISFMDLEEGVDAVTAEEVATRVSARLDGRFRPSEVGWFAPFRMHRRIVSRLVHKRRYLIGDAAHLSSPFGGEGLNAGLHDAHNLAWKLALVLQGKAAPTLIDAYTAERRIADAHVLDVSDQVHLSIVEMADAARERRELHAAVVDPVTAAIVRNSRAMIDVDYSGSQLVVDHGAGKAGACGPRPGQWYPDWCNFATTRHQVLVFGGQASAELEQFARRWANVVEVAHNPDVDAARAGLPVGGVVMVRPDGHVGFRFPAADADALQALDRHLATYLVPEN